MFTNFRLLRRWAGALKVVVALLLLSLRFADAQPLSERRKLAGQVVGSDGKPLEKAVVTVRRQTDTDTAVAFWGGLTVTDAQGQWSFPEAEDGSYYISIDLPGYGSTGSNLLLLDEGSKPLHITLHRLSPLNLHFLNPDGSALKAIKVSFVLTGGGSQRVQQPVTDETGSYTEPDLVPGPYLLQTVAPGHGFSSSTVTVAEAPEHPVTTDVHLQQGGAVHALVHETGEGGRGIGGTLIFVKAVGAPATTIQPWSLYLEQMVAREGDGAVDTDLTPGKYDVTAVLPTHESLPLQHVEVAAGQVANLDFATPAPKDQGSLQVTVTDVKKEPLADTDVMMQIRPLAANVPTVPAPPEMAASPYLEGLHRAHTGKDGKFTVYPLMPGKYLVTLSPQRQWIAPGAPWRAMPVFATAQADVTVAGSTVQMSINAGRSIKYFRGGGAAF